MCVRKNYSDNTTTITCDACGHQFVADSLNLKDAIDELEAYGGEAKYINHDWFHFCEACK